MNPCSLFPNMKYLAKGDRALSRQVTILEATAVIPISWREAPEKSGCWPKHTAGQWQKQDLSLAPNLGSFPVHQAPHRKAGDYVLEFEKLIFWLAEYSR